MDTDPMDELRRENSIDLALRMFEMNTKNASVSAPRPTIEDLLDRADRIYQFIKAGAK